MGNPYPSTGDVSLRCDETVEAVDFAWTPSHIRHHEEITAVDSLRAERITFLRTCAEVVTASVSIKRLALLVGTGVSEKPSPGWDVQDFKKTVYQDLTPGETLKYIVEDYFHHRTLCDATLWLQNTEAKKVHARVTENVLIDGRIDSFVLFDGMLLGKCIQPVSLHQPVTMPQRVVFHEVTLTNQETDYDAYVITLISGWAGHTTYLPADLPQVYGEGLQ